MLWLPRAVVLSPHVVVWPLRVVASTSVCGCFSLRVWLRQSPSVVASANAFVSACGCFGLCGRLLGRLHWIAVVYNLDIRCISLVNLLTRRLRGAGGTSSLDI